MKSKKETNAPLSFQEGMLVGNYRILSLLGVGGMGMVYKAQRVPDKKIVAIKCILESGREDNSRLLKRFLREAEVASSLSHPHIVTVYDTGTYNKFPYMVMEYIEGEPLLQFLTQTKATLEEKLNIMEKVAWALDYAHKRNVIHRDVKPSNIMVRANGEPVVMDFGLAKINEVEDRSLTHTGEVIGTIDYMAPEQARGLKKIMDARTDVYGLGGVMYHLLTGHGAVQGDTVSEKLCQIVSPKPVVPPSKLVTDIPAEVEQICLKAMSKKMAHRYETAGDFARDIRRYLESKPTMAEEFFRVQKKLQVFKVVGMTITALVSLALLVGVVNMLLSRLQHPTMVRLSLKEAEKYLLQARKEAQEKHYLHALDYVVKLRLNYPQHSQAIWLEAECLEKQNEEFLTTGATAQQQQYQDKMRLSWALLYGLKPSGEELREIGRKAMSWGYFEDAAKYLQEARQLRPACSETARIAGDNFLYLGQVREARKSYETIADPQQNPEILLGLASVAYYAKEYSLAIKRLEEMREPVTPFVQAQALLLKASIQWKNCEEDLYQKEWLLPDRHEEFAQHPMPRSLQEIETTLRQTAELVKPLKLRNYLMQEFASKVALYRQAFTCETQSPFSSQMQEAEMLQNQLAQQSLPPHVAFFFHKVMIRFWVRHQEWDKACRLCDECLSRYPWESALYHMRAISRFHLGQIPEAVDDIQRTLQVDPQSIQPIENIGTLLFSRLGQQEYSAMSRLILSYLSPGDRTEDILFRGYLEELQGNEQNFHLRNMPLNQKLPVSQLWHIITSGESAATREIAIDMLARNYENPELQSMLQPLPATTPYLQELQNAIVREKELTRYRRVKDILLCYAALGDEASRLAIINNEGYSETTWKILQDNQERPMMRFLAGQMLTYLKNYDHFMRLRETMDSKIYPTSWIAGAMVRHCGIPVAMPVTEEEYLARKQDTNREDALFYSSLLALYSNAKLQPKLCLRLLQEQEEIIAVITAYKLQTKELPADLPREVVCHRLTQLLKSQDPRIRALACRSLWKFRYLLGFAVMHEEFSRNEKHEEKYHAVGEHWKRFAPYLLESLRDPESQVRLAAMEIMIADPWFNSFLQKKLPQGDPTREQIEKTLYNHYTVSSSSFIKFWSALAWSLVAPRDKVWKLLENPQTSFWIKLAGLYRVLELVQRNKNITEFAKVAVFWQKLLGRKSDSVSDSQMKVMAILTMGKLNLFGQGAERAIAQCIQDDDVGVRRAALASMVWCGKAKDLKMLENELTKTSDIHAQRAIVTSLAGIVSKNRPSDIRNVQQILQKFSPERHPLLAQSAALGCYEFVFTQVINLERMTRNLEIFEDYSAYLENFKREAQADWLPFLQNAVIFDPLPRYLLETALLYTKLEKNEEALAYLEKAQTALRSCPQEERMKWEARCSCLRGLIYDKLGRRAESVRELERAYAASPFDEDINGYLHGSFLMQGNPSRTRVHVLQRFLCNPHLHGVALLLHIAHSAIMNDEQEVAIALLQAYHRLVPQKRSFFTEDPRFAAVRNHPWIQSLAD